MHCLTSQAGQTSSIKVHPCPNRQWRRYACAMVSHFKMERSWQESMSPATAWADQFLLADEPTSEQVWILHSRDLGRQPWPRQQRSFLPARRIQRHAPLSPFASPFPLAPAPSPPPPLTGSSVSRSSWTLCASSAPVTSCSMAARCPLHSPRLPHTLTPTIRELPALP
jgi:hypothetical protein